MRIAGTVVGLQTYLQVGKVPSLGFDMGVLLAYRLLYRLELADSLMVFGGHLADMVVLLAQILLESALVVVQQMCLEFESPSVLILGHHRCLV